MKNKLIFSTLLLSSTAQAGISAVDAEHHIGEFQTVCGYVADVVPGRHQTFINFDRNYPNQTFTVYINQNGYGNLHKFKSKNVCADGVITMHQTTPEIVNPDSIYIQ